MNMGHDISLRIGAKPRFPDRCVVCGRESPGHHMEVRDYEFKWWMTFFWWMHWSRAYSVVAPICPACHRKYRREVWIRRIITWAYIAVACVVAFPMFEMFPRWIRKYAAMGVVLVLFLPFAIVSVVYPLPFEVEVDGKNVEFKFRRADYAEEFAELNLADEEPSCPSAAQAQYEQMWNSGDFEGMIRLLEADLRAITPATPYHAILGCSFQHKVRAATEWLAGFYDRVSAEFAPRAIYIEMNRFDINFDSWYIEAFAHIEDFEEEDGYENECEYEPFVLTGMEAIQEAMRRFRDVDSLADENKVLLDAHNIAFQLVSLSMQYLVVSAWRENQRRGHPVGMIRVSAGVHDTAEEAVYFCRPDAAPLLAAAAAPSSARYVRLSSYQVKFPDSWRVDVDAASCDIQWGLCLRSPRGAFSIIQLYDDALLADADETQAAIEQSRRRFCGVENALDARQRAKKLVADQGIEDVAGTSLRRWGPYSGDGVTITGQVGDSSVTACVFVCRRGRRWFVAIEFSHDDAMGSSTPGFELIRSTFRLGGGDSGAEAARSS